VMKLGGIADLAQKSVEDPAAVHQLAADDLEHLLAAHEFVRGEVHHPHAAPAQFTEDLVVGVVRQIRRKRACRGWSGRTRAPFAHRQTSQRRTHGSR